MLLKYFTHGLLVSFLIKLLITGASIGDSLVIIALAGLFAFCHYLESKKEEPINTQVKIELTKVKEELAEVKSGLTAFKLSNQLRTGR